MLYHLEPAAPRRCIQQIGTDLRRRAAGAELPLAIRAVTAANTASALYSDAREGNRAADPRRPAGAGTAARDRRRERPAPRPAAARDAEASHRGEAAGAAGSAADGVRAAARAPGSGAQARRGAGIKDFQNIVSEGISDKLLEWKGIEATIELARSSNSKVVVVGNPKSGLPLIYAADR